MLDHPGADEYWATFDIESKHHRIEVPAYHLTGWYDTLLNGTLRNFAGLRANAANGTARRNQRLVVGPWTHSQPTQRSTIGDVDFGPSAVFSAQQLRLRWFRYWLYGPAAARPEDRAAVEGPPVRIFVMGANVWRDEQAWPLARATATSFFLQSGGKANSSAGDGALTTTAPAGGQPADRFVYDPWNPVPTGSSGGYSRSPADQSAVENRPDVLVYSTAPLTSDLEVTGPVSLTLWVASSAPDTDFTGKLVDVFPDGTARALTDGIRRARYRLDRRTPTLLKPGEPAELTIDLGATSNLFRAGHRIRLDVSSSNFPRFDRNPNTGGVFGEETELRCAVQTVLHDGRHPSRLVLPVIPPSVPSAK
jgi:putative CocE/NonD family hydrolase